MAYDTTPGASGLAMPPPPQPLIDAAMRTVPKVLDRDVFSNWGQWRPWHIDWLVSGLMERDHTELAARWAVHTFVEDGLLTVNDKGEIINLGSAGLWKWWRDSYRHEETDRKADTGKKSSVPKLPDSPEVLALCRLLQREIPKGRSRKEIAEESTNGDKKRAANLLRQARRYCHLYETTD